MLLTWDDFINNSKNPTEDFEDLCRVFFKIYYLKNMYYNLSQTTHNPGIETEPVDINGERVGFQAKFFSKNVSYAQILHSAKEIIKYYSGNIDKIIIFCNQNINEGAKDFVEAKRVLAENNISVELCCNKSILDVVSIGAEYGAIRNLFFNKLNLADEWFGETLKRSLDDLNPRYESGFHVDNNEIQRHFDLLYRNEAIQKYIVGIINEARNSLLQVTEYRNIRNAIECIINGFVVPNKQNYESVLTWYNEFDSITQAIAKEKEIVQNELNSRYANKENNDNAQWDKLYYKERQLNELDSIIYDFNFIENKYFQFINNNVLVVEGDCGQGKSHLLGYVAESQSIINGDNRTILLLGQKFIFSQSPQEQIVQMLGLNASFQEFVSACEARGCIDNKITVIMVDAINECYNQNLWKQYLNDIVVYIKDLKYVKFVCSIRTTYKEHIFSDRLLKNIESGDISLIKVQGFKNNLSEAIPYFFDFYKIPITTAAFFNFEFENPLFLRTYCEAYKNGFNADSKNIFALYEAYSREEEKKIREIHNITDGVPYTNLIISAIGTYMFKNNQNYIFESELYTSLSLYPNAHIILDGLIKAKVLLAYFLNNQRIIYICYERFADFLVAKHIVDSFDSYEALSSWIITDMLKTNTYGMFNKAYVEGRFSALSVLVREKYHKEIIDCLSLIDGLSDYTYNQIVLEYLNAISYRADVDIDEKDYYEYIVPHIQTQSAVEKHLDLLISLSGRQCSLNMNSTTRWLLEYPINERDYIWTLYINSHYCEGERIFYTVQYFLHDKLDYIVSEERVLYGQLLVWFFTASNRELRDKSSKALIRLMKNEIKVMKQLLNIFSNVNDPYIISRLYGCIYGAILQTENINTIEMKELCQYIYESVFRQDVVYPDILLRDYALNVIEYCVHCGVDMDFPIEECHPPYKSFDIPTFSIEKLNEFYPEFVRDKTFGTDAIKSSLAPEYGIKEFVSMYGDFGRYTFQSALRDFEEVDYEKVFSYAYGYIIETLGYKNEYFSDYDRHIGVGRSRRFGNLERIGKKYEWIAMHHILALVADSHSVDTKYYGGEKEYHGTWHPCVRDFDPTAQIENSNRVYEIGTFLARPIYSNWDLSNDDWTKIDDVGNLKENIRLIDNNGDAWIALYFSIDDTSSKDYEKDRQSVWLNSTACLIRKREFNNFINQVKQNKLYWRKLHVGESYGNSSVFIREYIWSPAFLDEYRDYSFSVEIPGKHIVKKKIPIFKIDGVPIEQVSEETLEETICDCSLVNLSIEESEEEREYNEPISKYVATVMPCYYKYLWERGQDYSNSDTVEVRLPVSYIIEQLGLKQIKDGVWSVHDEIACVDFKLIKGSNVDGLYIKEKYLSQIMNDDMTIVWVGMGEKQHLYGTSRQHIQSWSEIDSLIYLNKNNKFVEMQSIVHKGYNVEHK